jgi:hypothetical protein
MPHPSLVTQPKDKDHVIAEMSLFLKEVVGVRAQRGYTRWLKIEALNR